MTTLPLIKRVRGISWSSFMKRELRRIILLFFYFSSSGGTSEIAFGQIFRPEDWVHYTDSRYITSITGDLKTLYFATTRGILQYDRLKEEWKDPLPVIASLKEGPVRLIATDPFAPQLWLLTEEGLFLYLTSSYRVTEYTSLGGLFPREVESMGINAEGLWVEGGSRKVKFDRRERDWEVVLNYPLDITWFGKRSSDSLTSPEYRFLAPFTVKDEKFREYPITALKKDGKDLWVGTWGYGVFR